MTIETDRVNSVLHGVYTFEHPYITDQQVDSAVISRLILVGSRVEDCCCCPNKGKTGLGRHSLLTGGVNGILTADDLVKAYSDVIAFESGDTLVKTNSNVTDYQVSDAHWADTSRHTVVNAVGRYNRDLRDAYRLQNAAMANLSIRDYFRLSLKLFPPKKQIITQPKPVIISEPIIEPVKIISDQTSVVNEHNLQSPTPLNFPTVTQVNTNGIESDNIVIDKKVAAGVGIAAAVGLTLYAISKRK